MPVSGVESYSALTTGPTVRAVYLNGNPSFKKTVDDYVQDGGGGLGMTPTVGDPLVDGKILDKIRYARGFHAIDKIFLYTNAILLDKFGYENVLKSGITKLAIRHIWDLPKGISGFTEKTNIHGLCVI